MTIRNHNYTKDEVIVLTQGEYSDYVVVGVATVLKDFNLADEVKAYLVKNPECAVPYEFNRDAFVKHLQDAQLIQIQDSPQHRELHLGSYNSAPDLR